MNLAEIFNIFCTTVHTLCPFGALLFEWWFTVRPPALPSDRPSAPDRFKVGPTTRAPPARNVKYSKGVFARASAITRRERSGVGAERLLIGVRAL